MSLIFLSNFQNNFFNVFIFHKNSLSACIFFQILCFVFDSKTVFNGAPTEPNLSLRHSFNQFG